MLTPVPMLRPAPAQPEFSKISANVETLDWIIVGRVVGAWGLKGALKVQAFSEDPVGLLSSHVWRLQPVPRSETDKTSAPDFCDFKVANVRLHGGKWVVGQLAGLEVPEVAQTWRGCEISVPRSAFPSTTSSNEFYWVDLIGCEVVDVNRGALGIVSDLLDSPAHALLVIHPSVDLTTPEVSQVLPMPATKSGQVEWLIPFVDAHVHEVDIKQRRILVDWPDAL